MGGCMGMNMIKGGVGFDASGIGFEIGFGFDVCGFELMCGMLSRGLIMISG